MDRGEAPSAGAAPYPGAIASQLEAEAVAAGELALRLEVLGAVVAAGAGRGAVELATSDVATVAAKLQSLESQRLALVGPVTISAILDQVHPPDRPAIQAVARRARRAAERVEAAALRARQCLAGRLGAVEDVLASLDVNVSYGSAGQRRLGPLAGRGATA